MFWDMRNENQDAFNVPGYENASGRFTGICKFCRLPALLPQATRSLCRMHMELGQCLLKFPLEHGNFAAATALADTTDAAACGRRIFYIREIRKAGIAVMHAGSRKGWNGRISRGNVES